MSPSPNHSAPTSKKSATTSPPPTLAPTVADLLPAALPPIILAAGSIFTLLSPCPSAQASYFSQKGNIFNVFFVKYGWLWTTIVFAIHVFRLRFSSKQKALLRYFLATIWWIVVTQWFFGAPIMDRLFTLTGGTCKVLAETGGPWVLTSAACKHAGGKWSGGHDLSGHVFLLTHAFLFLTSEVMPLLVFGGEERKSFETAAVGALAAVWLWMLLMTGIYFHTWTERMTGLVLAMVEWAVVYAWGLRTNTVIREIWGVPGI
ncbi:hypothetical protein RUND412_005245 [Rhizina undulata]